MRKKKLDYIINKENYSQEIITLSREGLITMEIAKIMYQNVGRYKKDRTNVQYYRWLSYHYPKYTDSYYRKLHRVYEFFIVKNKFCSEDICDINIEQLYRIASSKKGIFTKHIILDMLGYLTDIRSINKNRIEFIWRIKNRRLSLLKTIEELQSQYDADVVEKFYQIHEV